mgnify:CR=1 FL=1
MKSKSLFKSEAFILLMVVTIINAGLPAGVVWAAGNPPALSAVPIPSPSNLGDFVKDKAAAIKLGKALFWDMNVGGDGGQACASCHYRAGADPFDVRHTNQINPGPNGGFDIVSGPNTTLTPAMHPFTQVQNPGDPATKLKDGLIFHLFQNPVEHIPPELGVGDFAAAEKQ